MTALTLTDSALDGLDDLDFLLDAVAEKPAPVPVAGRQAFTNWPPALVVDVALGLDSLDDILARYGLTLTQWDYLSDNPSFKIDLARARKELAENGLSFRRKAAVQAEMYLEVLDEMMLDVECPPSVKTDIFKTLARLGDLEPEKKAPDAAGAGASFNIQINF